MGGDEDFIEVGKSFGTLMSNTVRNSIMSIYLHARDESLKCHFPLFLVVQRFYQNLQTAQDPIHVQKAVNEFLDESIILPPGKWYG